MALLDVKDLSVRFHTRNGVVNAVEEVSFSVNANETLAIVGESGSGKSVTCYSLLNLIPQPPGKIESGSAVFNGSDLLQMSERQLQSIRGSDIAIIFQDPMTCLNPFLTVGEQLIEPLIYHRKHSRLEARLKAIAVLDEVGIKNPEQAFLQYPHHFSGGMRQRVMIAMALITEPKLLIADEPTTALDVTIQAQILTLIKELQRKRNIAVIFISHDLAVVSDIADSVIVMYQGRIVEQGSRDDIFKHSQHEYTQKLLASIPSGKKVDRQDIKPIPLVTVKDLNTHFSSRVGGVFSRRVHHNKAVNDVSFDIYQGEIVGLVGESGSGKSTTGRSILQLLPVTSGSVKFKGEELTTMRAKQLAAMRRHMQMIFQDPYASLNPRMTVLDILSEPLLFHGIADKGDVLEQVITLMDDVGLDHSSLRKYPHEFSGGQRQRIAIGRALATKPELVIADEPVSALDVTIQSQILELILSLVKKHNLTMLFISHDLSVVRRLCDRVIVMNHGKIVEAGNTEELYTQPAHNYTQSLLSAIPVIN